MIITNYIRFLNEKSNTSKLSDKLKEILTKMNHPIAKDILNMEEDLPLFIEISDNENGILIGKSLERMQPTSVGRLVYKILPINDPRDVESFVSMYRATYPSVAYKNRQYTPTVKIEDKLIDEFIQKNSDKYMIQLDKDMYQNIRDKYCKTFNKNGIKFFRGDKKPLEGDFYLLNGYNTKTKLQFPFNYITVEFVSSNQWSDKKLPIKKHSVNMSNKKSVTSIFGNTYAVIPFDNATLVCLPALWGNYSTDRFKKEFGDLFWAGPSNLAQFLERFLNSNEEFTYENSTEMVKRLVTKFNNITDEMINSMDKDDKNIINVIMNNMKTHNMLFREYMEYLFEPENYDIIKYEDMNTIDVQKYRAEYTNSRVLVVNMNKLNESIL